MSRKRPWSLHFAAGALLVPVVSASPASAHGDGHHLDLLRAEADGIPILLTSPKVHHLTSCPARPASRAAS